MDVRKIWVMVKPLPPTVGGSHGYTPYVVTMSNRVSGTFDRNIVSGLAHEITHATQQHLLGLQALADFRYFELVSWGEKGQYKVGQQWLAGQRIEHISPVTGGASLEAVANRYADEVWNNWKGPN